VRFAARISQNESGRIFIQPLRRNPLKGKSRTSSAANDRGDPAYFVPSFFSAFFFFFFLCIAMAYILWFELINAGVW
jgi:hypothetical protein